MDTLNTVQITVLCGFLLFQLLWMLVTFGGAVIGVVLESWHDRLPLEKRVPLTQEESTDAKNNQGEVNQDDQAKA